MSRAEEWARLLLWPESIPAKQQWHEGTITRKQPAGEIPAQLPSPEQQFPKILTSANGQGQGLCQMDGPLTCFNETSTSAINQELLSFPRLPLRFILQVHLLSPCGVQGKPSPTPQVKKRHIWCCIWFWVFLQELNFNTGCDPFLYPKKT